MGTESANAVATPANAFSAPGPACIAKTPVFSPFEILEYPSAKLTPTLSCLKINGLIPIFAPASSRVLNGITPMKSTPSDFKIFAIKSAPVISSPLVHSITTIKRNDSLKKSFLSHKVLILCLLTYIQKNWCKY